MFEQSDAFGKKLEEVSEQGDISIEELNQWIERLCITKSEEFHLLGYEHVTGQDVWDCVSNTYSKGMPRLHQIVNDILSLRVTKFMNWMTMSIYKQG
jgi:hypothetical protein